MVREALPIHRLRPATHAPAGVKRPAELDRQLLVSWSGVQAAGHGFSLHLVPAVVDQRSTSGLRVQIQQISHA